MSFWKRSTKDCKQLNCYRTIDELPIKIWFDIHKTGLLILLLKDNSKLKDKDYLELDLAWDLMYNDFLKRFGFSEEFEADLQAQIRVAKLQADFIITGQRHFKTLANIEKEELKRSRKRDSKPLELNDVLAKMTKYYGVRLRADEFTTAEYYTYIKNIDGKKN